jgi:quercetin dioxygenase-like cupin family protein
MRVIETASGAAEPITEFDSVAATRVVVADGVDARAYAVSFEPGGSIGPHTAGLGQLFIPVALSGWAAGGDGQRHRISVGQIAHIARGEVHSKGSDTGMTAVMVQVRDLDIRGG